MIMTLRRATQADQPFIAHLEEVCMRGYAVALWGRWIPRPAEDFVAARHRIIVHDGADAGCIEAVLHADHVWIDKLYLLPGHRRQGLGAAVLREAIEEARRLGLPLRLSVLVTNPAEAFYRREGLRVVSRDEERIRFESAPE